MTSPIKFDQTTVGSVGSLIGAALESAGHYLQSEVLDLFSSGLAESLGALLYIISAVFAIFLIAVGGNYKHGAWFLLGPAFFYFLIAVRVDSTGPEWNFGGLERDNTQLGEALRGVSARGTEELPESRSQSGADRVYEIEQNAANEFGKKARVSWFFARWNKLSSQVVNNFIAVVNQSNKYRDVQFITKVDKYARVINAKTDDQELIQFFHSLVITKCSRLYSLKMDLYSSGISEPRRVVIQKELENGLHGKLNQKIVNLTYEENHADTLDYLREYFFDEDSSSSLNSRYSQIFNSGEFPISNPELYNGNLSCGQLWQLSMILFKDNADLLIPAIFAEGMMEDLPANESRNALLNQFRKESECPGNLGEDGECLGYEEASDNPLEPLRHPSTISSDEMAYNTMLNEMAGRMILDELKNASSDIIGHELESRVLEKDKFNEWQKSGTSSLVRDLHGGIEFLGKGDFLTSMLSMPYMQGLALYFLALVFPFFALVVLIPGRQNGFFLWMGLWFWIKSWDFGFAVVMMISDMLYVLLPQGPALTDGDLSSPDIVMKKLLEVDPSYSVYLYYRLVATCLAAVPLLTGVLVQRGGGEIMKAIEQGFKDFGGRIGHSMDQMERAILAGDQAARARMHMVNGINDAAANILKNNRELQNTLIKALGAQAVASAMEAGSSDSNAIKFGQDIAHAANQANATRALKTANAIYKAELSMKAFELSNDHYTVSKSARAVAQGMFMRHPGRFIPMDDLLDVMLESVNSNMGDKIENVIKDHSMSAAGAFSYIKQQTEKMSPNYDENQTLSAQESAKSMVGPILGDSSQIDGFTTQGNKNAKPVWSLETAIKEESLLYNQNDKDEIHYSGISSRAGGHNPGSQRYDAALPGSQASRPIEEDFEIGKHRGHGYARDSEGNLIQHAVPEEKLRELQVQAHKVADAAEMTVEERAVFFAMISHSSGWNPSYADTNSDGAGLFNESVANMKNNYQRLVDSGFTNGISQEEIDRGEYPNRFLADNSLKANAYKIVSYRDKVDELVRQDQSRLPESERQNFDAFEQKVRYTYAFATEEAPNTFDQGGAQHEVTQSVLPYARHHLDNFRNPPKAGEDE